MPYNSTTTLNRIRAARPCHDGWTKLLKHLGKTAADDEPLPLLTVLDSNGFDHALWVLSYAMPDDRLARHFQAGCAEQLLHLFEAEHPGDGRVRAQIAMLRNDDATVTARAESRDAARNAAWNADAMAARNAAWSAAADVALASSAAASDAAWDAAWDATAALGATAAAARAAARNAAWTAAAARDAQEAQLRAMIGE